MEPFRGQFHTKIATCHHDTIGGIENSFELIDCFRLFELGNDHRRRLVVAYELAKIGNISGITDERKWLEINFVLQPDDQIASYPFP